MLNVCFCMHSCVSIFSIFISFPNAWLPQLYFQLWTSTDSFNHVINHHDECCMRVLLHACMCICFLFSIFISFHNFWLLLLLKTSQVYFQLENLSRADPPYKSVAALNCIILGCANIWDLDRAYQTFEAISGTFGLTASIHSYNALMSAFGKLKKVRISRFIVKKPIKNSVMEVFFILR